MKTKIGITLALCSTFLIAANSAHAHDGAFDTVLGGAIGGGAGAIIGKQIGGRNGAIVGGALGAATGVYIATEHRQQVEYVPTPAYIAPRPVVYYGPPVVYVEARGHGRYNHHHKHHNDGDDRGDWREDRHEHHHWD